MIHELGLIMVKMVELSFVSDFSFEAVQFVH